MTQLVTEKPQSFQQTTESRGPYCLDVEPFDTIAYHNKYGRMYEAGLQSNPVPVTYEGEANAKK